MRRPTVAIAALFGLGVGSSLPGLVLDPIIEPPDTSSEALTQRDEMTLYWGQPAVGNNGLECTVEKPYLASLRINTMQSAFRGIISFEDMHTHGLLASLDCSSASIRLSFKDSVQFEAAEKEWDVGTDSVLHEQEFVAIVGKGQCGMTTEGRRPFLIKQASSSKDGKTIAFVARDVHFGEILQRLDTHSYKFRVGPVPSNNHHIQILTAARSFDAAVATCKIPLAVKLSFPKTTVWLQLDKVVGVYWKCKSCGVDWHFELYGEAGGGVLPKFWIESRTVRLYAKVVLGINVDFQAPDALMANLFITSVPIQSIGVPSLFEVGGFLDVWAKAGLNTINAGMEIEGGGEIILEEGASYATDHTRTKWQPKIERYIPHVSGYGNVGAKAALVPEFVLGFSLGPLIKFGLGISIDAPHLKVSATISADAPGTECGKKANDTYVSLAVNADIGTDITANFYAGFSNTLNRNHTRDKDLPLTFPKSLSLYGTTFIKVDHCYVIARNATKIINGAFARQVKGRLSHAELEDDPSSNPENKSNMASNSWSLPGDDGTGE